MSWIAVGVGSAALIGGISGAIISSNGAQSAAQTQANAANQSNQTQYNEFEQIAQSEQPWTQAGATAIQEMGSPTFQQPFTMQDFQEDPGYQFDLSQGQQAIQRSAAASGGLMSGGTLKSINNYSQGMASNEYQNAYNRFTQNQTNQFNRLASIAGTGQTANGQVVQAGTNMADQVGQNTMGAANAKGAAQIAGANAFGSTLSSLGTQVPNTWMQQQYLNRMFPSGGTPGASQFGSNINGTLDSTPQLQMPEFGSTAAPSAPTFGDLG